MPRNQRPARFAFLLLMGLLASCMGQLGESGNPPPPDGGTGEGGMAGTGLVGTGAAGTGAAGTGVAGTGVAGTGAAGTDAGSRGGTGVAGTGAAGTGAAGTGAAGTGAAGTGAAGTGAGGRGGTGAGGRGGSGAAGRGGTGGSGSGGAAGAASDPLTVPARCTSAVMWTQGDRGSSQMNPGRACINCHTTGGRGPRFTIAGTLYPTGHEPDLCNGANGTNGARIVITGANGTTLTLTPNAAGNFYSETAVTAPYKAKVTYMGRERAMVTMQTSGDCNSCHTQNGANSAPGRIVLP